ncbi:aldo/keto reductase [Bordetella genomosp. 4]|uniref:Aldo/keto reductase n=1 Tax=Bordetella genomosp. 4 TaxID=463044 RepID=A0A261U285_9BORD|nr:aldo/keto reductase [Bordetella genomosp. 4]OZI55989.1 aldo/keto reductase [Bordetella genomosp. 4]
MFTRRRFVYGLSALGAGIQLPGMAMTADTAMNTRRIPSSGQTVPVIGMGTADSFNVGDTEQERAPLREVMRRFFAAGASVIDTAPSYGQSETVIGDLLAELGLRDKAFLCTKIGTSGREAGRAQFQESLRRLKTDKVELLQVHNLRDWRTQLALIQELKARGVVRYSGLTHYYEGAHDELADAVQASKPDFLQINYSVIATGAEKRLFPLAQNLGIAVLVNRAFEDGRLFREVGGKALPGWAAEAGITSWAQAFLRFAISPPAVTAVIPATSRPDRQSDNLRAGYGQPLTAEQRRSLQSMFA